MDPFLPDLDDPAVIERLGPTLRQALTIRLVEQRLLQLFSEGKLFGTLHTSIGQEFVGPAVAAALLPGDSVLSNHRCHGHFIARTDQVEGLVAEIMGKSTGVCGGLGGSQHLHHDRFWSSGVLGGTAPIAAGLALSHRLEAKGDIAVLFLGDGALGEGVVYESANLAARWNLPLLFVLENNGYAQSTPQAQTLAGGILERFQAFGIATARSSTWAWDELVEGVRASVDRVRREGRPRLHLVDTYRLMGHSKGDDNRPDAEVEPFRQRDPLNQLMKRAASHPWLTRTLAEIGARLDGAVARAEAAGFGPTPAAPASGTAPRWQPASFRKERVLAGVRGALAEALESNRRAIVIGEDIESPYGGAFKATAGLSERHPERVRNTPISEAALVGMGTGLALGGWHPVVEVMFGDFLTLATDQWVNHAAKFAAMYGRAPHLPLVVRTPMGGRRGYGPTHSQSLERLFVGQPGTRVVALHHRDDPSSLYRAIFAAADRPTLVVENKLLYGAFADSDPPAGFALLREDGPFGASRLKPQGKADVTLVAFGGMSVEAEEAARVLFEEHEVLADVFLPAQLYPLDAGFLRESLAETRALVVAEEGQGFAALGSELLAQVAEMRDLAPVRCGRVSAAPCPIPGARPLEAACLPDAAAIITRVLEVLRG
jgi:2-oxoisovalerate dehydrogenase E1 component